MDRTPADPAGISTRTRVSSGKPRTGTNWTVVGLTRCQLPAIAGATEGIGESAASGAENVTRIALAPLTPRALDAGVTDTTVSGVAGAWCLRWPAVTFWPEAVPVPRVCADAPLRANQVPPASRATMAVPSATIRQRSCPSPDNPSTP